MTDEPLFEVDPLTPDEITDLALHMLAERVFCHHEVPTDLWPTVYLPMMLFPQKFPTPEAFMEFMRDKAMYGINGVDKTLARSINGYPIFAEIRLSLAADYNKAIKVAVAMIDAGTGAAAKETP